MEVVHFEPEASALQGLRSTAELRAHMIKKKVGERRVLANLVCFYTLFVKKKGGDPAAGSPTATL